MNELLCLGGGSPNQAAEGPGLSCARGAPLDQTVETLEEFLAGVERRAFRIAQIATQDREEALDLVRRSCARWSGVTRRGRIMNGRCSFIASCKAESEIGIVGARSGIAGDNG